MCASILVGVAAPGSLQEDMRVARVATYRDAVAVDAEAGSRAGAEAGGGGRTAAAIDAAVEAGSAAAAASDFL